MWGLSGGSRWYATSHQAEILDSNWNNLAWYTRKSHKENWEYNHVANIQLSSFIGKTDEIKLILNFCLMLVYFYCTKIYKNIYKKKLWWKSCVCVFLYCNEQILQSLVPAASCQDNRYPPLLKYATDLCLDNVV